MYYSDKKTVRIERKEAVRMEEIIHMYIKSLKLSAELNRQRVYVAWAKVSGAAQYTLDRYMKSGVLHCVISSSMVRTQLYLNRKRIVDMINKELDNDELFIKEDKIENYVKSIVLK